MTQYHKTQGKQLYVLDNTVSPVAVLRIAQLTNMGSLGGQAKEIPITTFDDLTHEQTISGLIKQGDMTLNMIFGMDVAGHQFLKENVGSDFQFAVGWSDGYNIPPTVNASGDGFDLPATRSWSNGEASISQEMKDFNADEVVRMTSALRTKGSWTDVPKTA